MRVSRNVMRFLGAILVGLLIWLTVARWGFLFEKRVRVVVPGELIRGAWQTPRMLNQLIQREGIRTVVTLTAINETDPKYVGQAEVTRQTGVDWVLIPMRGSTATLEQMGQAADLLADPQRQPVFFHCVAGHHRTSLAHAAYRIRHDHWTAEQAWVELCQLPWTRQDHAQDQADHELIIQFERREAKTAAPEVTARVTKAATQ